MIELRHISKSYDGKCVICNQSLTIRDGEFFVLVGPSGSGKTTMLKMINRLIPQTEGDIYIDGKHIEAYPLRALRLTIGYVLQQIALFPNLTVYENISLIPEIKKWKKADRLTKTKLLLEKAGLNPQRYLHRYPKELSGGEQQRVGILRAVIGEPHILLMDEPFSALDPISRTQLQDLIKRIHTALQLTIVFVTHDMQEALKLGDRICVMKEGAAVQLGTPDEIRNHPANEFVKAFFN